MPFVPVYRQAPIILPTGFQIPNTVNITEIQVLNQQISELEIRNLELYSQLVTERDLRHDIEVKHSILEMEFETERIKNQELLAQNSSLKEDYNKAFEECGRLKDNRSTECKSVATQLESNDLSPEYLSLVTQVNQLEGESNILKADLAKSKSQIQTLKVLKKRILKSRKLKAKKIQQLWKCCICRNSFSNPVIFYKHRKLSKTTTAGPSSSSKASLVASSSKTIPAAYTEQIKSADVEIQETSSTITTMSFISSSNLDRPIANDLPISETSFNFLIPKPRPITNLCSVALTRISTSIPSIDIKSDSLVSPENECAKSVALEFVGNRVLGSNVRKHSRDLTRRHQGYYCLCGIQFIDRKRLDRHLRHLKMMKPTEGKKRLLCHGKTKTAMLIKVEQDD